MHRSQIARGVLVTLLMVLFPLNAIAQTDAFTYQGSLVDSGGMADGQYDFEFGLYATETGGSSLRTDRHLNLQVLDGLFSVEIDFGSGVFSSGSDRYLEIRVRMNGEPSFTPLSPRVLLNSVPFAAHADDADVAAYALDGPFEALDTSPDSDSGVPGQNITTVLNLDGDIYMNVEPVFPINLEREIIETQSGLIPGNYADFVLEFRAEYTSQSQLEQHFDAVTAPVTVEIITETGGTNECIYKFFNGAVSGYRLEQDRLLVEVITISFLQQTQNPLPLSNFASRSTNGFNPIGPGPWSPYLGGNAVLPDTYFYEYAGSVPEFSSVAQFPGQERLFINGSPRDIFDERPLEMLHNTYHDRFNVMWDQFASANPSAPQPVKLRDTNGVIWSTPSYALISGWILDIADDGGLYETYEFQYSADVNSP